MPSFCDRLGFPVAALPALGMEIQLLPATKVQFEAFLAEPNDYGDAWYQQVLAVNPRLATHRATAENYEGLFLTGIFPAEAEAFGKWLGPGWGLPEVGVWRRIRAAMAGVPCRPYLEQVQGQAFAPAAVAVLRRLIEIVRPRDMLELSMLTGGVLEWVQDGPAHGGLGTPRLSFWGGFCDPVRGQTKRPQRADLRVRPFGFRLVRPLSSPAGARRGAEASTFKPARPEEVSRWQRP